MQVATGYAVKLVEYLLLVCLADTDAVVRNGYTDLIRQLFSTDENFSRIISGVFYSIVDQVAQYIIEMSPVGKYSNCLRYICRYVDRFTGFQFMLFNERND